MKKYSFDELLKLADRGNVRAQLYVAWQYGEGDQVDRSIERSEYWYDRAKASGAEDKVDFYRIKSMYFNNDEGIRDFYYSRHRDLGAIDFIYAKYLMSNGFNKDETVNVLIEGARKGSKIARWHLHIVRHSGIWRFLHAPSEILMVLGIFVNVVRDPDSDSILM